MKVNFNPSNLPKCSFIVNRSPRIWHGWEKFVKPLTIGTEEYFANSSKSLCSYSLAIITFTYLEVTFEKSFIDSFSPRTE